MTPAKKPAKKAAAPVGSMAALHTKMTAKYGTGRVVRREEAMTYEVVSTGSLTLDLATRVGGWVLGRTHEIVGPEGQGKTTLCINSMIEAQAKFKRKAVGYIDMEQTFDYAWAEALGLDTSPKRWLHVYPDDSEDVSDQLKDMLTTGLFSMIVVDSIGGMESKEAFDKDAGDKVMGRNAQVITRMVKSVAVDARKHKAAILFVNQYRANFSGMGSDISAGPKALKYNTTMKVTMQRVEDGLKADVDGDDIEVGRKIRCRVVRSKVAVQGKQAEFWLFNHPTSAYGPIGIDRADETLTLGGTAGVIGRRGSWYDLPDGTAHNGAAAVKAHLRTHPEVMSQIRDDAVAKKAADVTPVTEVAFDHDPGE